MCNMLRLSFVPLPQKSMQEVIVHIVQSDDPSNSITGFILLDRSLCSECVLI